MCGRQYDAPSPPDGGMWDQLHEQVKTNRKLLKPKSVKNQKTLVRKTELINPHDNVDLSIPKAPKDKMKSREGSGMESDQVEQLDMLLNQSVKVLNKKCDTEETDASTTSKWNNRSSPFNSKKKKKKNKAKKIITKRKVTELTFGKNQSPGTGTTKSIIVLQKLALTSSDTPEEQLEK